MEELAFRIRLASPEDAAALRSLVRQTMAHPEGGGRREGLKSAAERGELMVLERYDPREKTWKLGGFAEFHLRVDDTLTLKDVGSVGDTPHAGIVKQLINELLRSTNPVAATAKLRADARVWNEILADIPGFELEGEEYRRPHWIRVWKWTREAARRAGAQRRRGERRPRPAPPR